MTSIVIANLPEDVEQRLRAQAAKHGRSIEDEARTVLGKAFGARNDGDEESAGDLFRRCFGPENGVDLAPLLVEREPGREPPNFD